MELKLVDSTIKEKALEKLSKAQKNLLVEKEKIKEEKKQRELVKKEAKKQEELEKNSRKCAKLFVDLSPTHFEIKESQLADFKNKQELAVLGGKLAQMVQLRANLSLAAAVIYISGCYAGLMSLGTLFPAAALTMVGILGGGGLIVGLARWVCTDFDDDFEDALKFSLSLASCLVWAPFYLIRCILPCATDLFSRDNTEGAYFQFKHFHYLRLCQKLKKLNGQDYFPSDEVIKRLELK